MRILFLSDNFPPESNAPATRLWEHASRWVQHGHEVTVITCAPNFPEGKLFHGYQNRWRQVEFLGGIRVVRVKTYITANEGFIQRTLDYMSFMVTAFFFGLFERRPDVVVATSPQFFCAIGGWMLSIAKWRPFVFELRDLWPASIMAVGAMKKSLLIQVLERLELFLYARAERIVAVTESFRQDLIQRGVASEKIAVIQNGVDLSCYYPRPRDSVVETDYQLQDKFVVGYIGTHGMAHSLNVLVLAAELLRAHSDIVFIFVGAGAHRSLVELLVTEKHLKNVRLIGRQPKNKIPAFWSVCDVSIVSLKDAAIFSTVIPSKIFESMGMGVPILMSLPDGEATRLIKDHDVGVCITPDSPEEMANALIEMARAKEDLDRFRRNAELASRYYSRDRLAREILNEFREATSVAKNAKQQP